MKGVREHILSEHVTLRAALRGLAVLARSARRDPSRVATLRSATLDVIDLVLAHMAHEEAVLGASAATPGAWSEARRARLRRDHGEQRALLANLGALLEAPISEGPAIARIVDGFVTSVLRDMDDEERVLIGSSLAPALSS